MTTLTAPEPTVIDVTLPEASLAATPAEHMSSRYRFIHTAEIVQSLRAEGFMPVRAKQRRVRNPERAPFTRHMVVFRLPDQPTLRKRGDIAPEIVLFNAHDGTSPYRIHVGIFRMVCENGLIVSAGDTFSMRVPHTGTNTTEQVIQGTHELVERVPTLLEQVDTWRTIDLAPERRRAFAADAMMLRWPGDHQPVQPMQLLAAQRDADQASDLFTTMNVVQEMLIRSKNLVGVSKDGKERKVKAIRSIDTMARLNLGLWELAANYANN
jgi:hypothetical protein